MARIGEGVARAGYRVFLLGSNERWTTFVPTDYESFDPAIASKRLNRPLLHLLFSDEEGVTAVVYVEGECIGELFIPISNEDGEDGFALTDADHAFLRRLEELGMMTADARKACVERVATRGDEYWRWVRLHGLERLLELPYDYPVPLGPEDEVYEILLENEDAPPKVIEASTDT